MNTKIGFLSLLTCGLMLAAFGGLVRILNQYFGVFTQVGGRTLITLLLILIYLLFNKISFKHKVTNWPLFASFIISYPLYIVFFALSVINTKLANAMFYLFANSLLTSFVIGFLFFNERNNKKNIITAILLFIGMIFLTYPFDLNQSWKGVVAGILGGICWGISNATRKHYADKINKWLAIFYQMIVGTILSVIIASILNEFVNNHLTSASFFMLFIYGFGMVFLQILLFIGFKHFPLNLGSIVLASQLLFIQFLGIIIFQEIPTLTEILGSLFVFFAIILTNTKGMFVKLNS